jgi:hypothetical protein
MIKFSKKFSVIIFSLLLLLVFSLTSFAFEKVDVTGAGFASEAVYAAKVRLFMGHAEDDPDYIWVSTEGSDALGDGSIMNPYASITKAFTDVTAAINTVLVLPGEYIEAASLTWPEFTGTSVVGVAGGVTITGLSGETEVILIDPTIKTATFEATLRDLEISCPDGVNGITFDNATVNRKINLYLENVGINCDTETDKAINATHTIAGEAMRIYASGHRNIFEGLVYIAPKNVDDRFFFDNLQFDGGIEFGTATIASSSMFKDCIMKDGGGDGGQDTQILSSLACYSLTSETTYAIAALGDYAANAAEVILP